MTEWSKRNVPSVRGTQVLWPATVRLDQRKATLQGKAW